MADSRVKDLVLHGTIDSTNDSFLVEDAATDTTKRTTLTAVKTALGLTGTNSGDQNIFSTIAVSGQSDVVADSTSDTLTFVQGTNVTLTTNAATDSITFNAIVDGANVGAAIASVSEKTVPVDADSFALVDSAAANTLKRLTWANAKIAIKAYADTIYAPLVHTHVVSDIVGVQYEHLIGRHGGGTGPAQEIKVDGGLEIHGSSLRRSALVGDVTASAGDNTTTISNGAVTYAKIQNVSATSRVLGRRSAGTGVVEELTATQILDFIGTTEGQLLYRTSTAWAVLSPGNSGTVLTSTGTTTAPQYQALPMGGSTNLWIPADKWLPRITDGPGSSTQETTVHKQNFKFLLFDASLNEYAQCVVVMPNNYNLGTVKARFYWSASGAFGPNNVVWALNGRAFADSDLIDQGYGTAATVVDTVTSVSPDDVMISDETGPVTLAGTVGANQLIQFQIFRDAANASDTYGHDAKLIGVEIIYNA